MPLLPTRVWLDAAMAIADHSQLTSAFDTVLNSICEALGAQGMLLLRKSNGWRRVASRVPEGRAAAWRPGISAIANQHGPIIRVEAGRDPATAIILMTRESRALMLVLGGEWTASRDSLAAAQALAFAFDAVREREAVRELKREAVRTYRATRQLQPALGIQAIGDRLVNAAAQSLGASRVSLALVDSGTGQVRLTALRGVPQWLRDETVPRDRGVIGRVLQSRRPVLASADANTSALDRYRGASYVAAPILAGPEVIGVLCATDKHDLEPFNDRDCATLRALAAASAGPLMAATAAIERDRAIEAAAVDPLTKLFNRQHIDLRLQQELERTRRENTTAALLVVDVDDFKKINDSSGHQGGDRVLVSLGDIIRSAVRAIDVCARYGGDEFVVLMPNTDVQSAHACARRIAALASEHQEGETNGGRVTISVGVAVSTHRDDASALFARADKALYAAKAAGKNRIWLDTIDTTMEDAPAHRELSYVLVADPHVERLAHYRDWIAPFRTGLLVARHGSEALSIVERFGPPLLLFVDLTAPAMSGAELLEAVRGGPTRVLAWSDVANSAVLGAADTIVHLAPDASMVAAKHAAHQLLTSHPAVPPIASPAPTPDVDIDTLTEQLRGLVGSANIAIYLPTADEQHFRAVSTWYAGVPPSTTTYDLRSVFTRVRDSRQIVTSGAVQFVASSEAMPAPPGVPGLVAIPMIRSGAIRAIACVYDNAGLVIRQAAIDAITAIVTPAERRRAEDRGAEVHWEAGGEHPLALLERKSGETVAIRELARARREQRQLSVVLFELAQRTPPDRMMSNDTFEPVVDTFLKAVRQSDLPIRWGANELLLILPGLTGTEARHVAERVRAAMQAGARHTVAVAGGVAEADPAVRQFEEVIARARERVAMAVDRGHNRVH